MRTRTAMAAAVLLAAALTGCGTNQPDKAAAPAPTTAAPTTPSPTPKPDPYTDGYAHGQERRADPGFSDDHIKPTQEANGEWDFRMGEQMQVSMKIAEHCPGLGREDAHRLRRPQRLLQGLRRRHTRRAARRRKLRTALN